MYIQFIKILIYRLPEREKCKYKFVNGSISAYSILADRKTP